jgi:electron transport complex protein RnfC
LQQHVGAPAEPEVAAGDRVKKGQLLAHSQGAISASVHAPTSGTVVSIGDFAAPHPSGLPVRTMIVEADGEDRWTALDVPPNPFDLEPDEVAARVGAAGIVGLGGATFPAAVKLSLGLKKRVHTLITNGGESEPYLTCDDRLMRERADGIVDGARIMLHALQADRVLIAIESNKPAALKALAAASAMHGNVQAVQVPARYPMGSANQMIQTLTGMEVPAEGRSADLGVIVHNVGTAYAVHRAVRLGQPLISRVITVSGGAVWEWTGTAGS